MKSSRSVLPITLIRIARGIQCGWSRTNGRAMPNRNSCRYFLPSGASPAQPAELQFSARIVAVANREPVTIHPDDAQARGIQDGDTVRLWNARGQILAGAVISEGIKPGVICIHEGARPDLDLTADGICKNGAVNVLTKDLPSSRLGNGCAGNTALAWLEKYNGPELTLTAFEPPASS